MTNTKKRIAYLAVLLALLVPPVGLAQNLSVTFNYAPCIGAPINALVTGPVGKIYTARFNPVTAGSQQHIIFKRGALPAVMQNSDTGTGEFRTARPLTRKLWGPSDNWSTEVLGQQHIGPWTLTVTGMPFAIAFTVKDKCSVEQQVGLRVTAAPSTTSSGIMDVTATVNEGVSPLYWTVNGSLAFFALGGEDVYYASIPLNAIKSENIVRLIAKLGTKTTTATATTSTCQADLVPDGCYASPIPLGSGNVCILKDSAAAGTTRVCLPNGQQSTQQLCCSSPSLAPIQADVTAKFAVTP